MCTDSGDENSRAYETVGGTAAVAVQSAPGGGAANVNDVVLDQSWKDSDDSDTEEMSQKVGFVSR